MKLFLSALFVLIASTGNGMGLSNGDPIQETPAPALVEEQVTVVGDFGNPKGISNFSRSTLIVADGLNNLLRLVDKEDSKITEFYFETRGRPTALIRIGKRIYVGNDDYKSIDVYDFNGRMKRVFHRHIYHASDITNYGRKVFVVDSYDKSIQIFNTHGLWLRELRIPEMPRPSHIVIDKKRKQILVSDNGDSKLHIDPSIVIFNRKGKFKGRIEGSEYGFSRPRGLAIYRNTLYITDTLLCKIITIDLRTMTRLEDIGEFGAGDGQLISPKDIHFDRRYRSLYVINNRLGKVETFNLGR